MFSGAGLDKREIWRQQSDMSTTIDSALERIRAYMVARQWTPTELARAAGLPESTIRPIARPNWSPSMNTLRALESIIPADFEAAAQNARDHDSNLAARKSA